MIRLRVLSAIPLAALGIGVTIIGGGWFNFAVFVVFGVAVVEFVQLMARKGHRAFGGLAVLWVATIMLDRAFPWLGILEPAISVLTVATLGWALIRFRQGTPNAATGFALTIAGGIYLGWTGAQFVSLRAYPEGLFWTLTVLIAVWSSDSIAYFAGTAFGRNALIPDISPRKTWEGYLVAIAGATALTAASTLLWRALGAGDVLAPIHGMMIGLLVSVIAPIGDLGMSMFKCYAGAKDSGHLIPGHGGVLDRIDALMIAGLLAYHYLLYFVPQR
jgi:phosphatidate cytidylyltransferase